MYNPFLPPLYPLLTQPFSLCLKSTILAAYDVFIVDEKRERIGQTVEAAHDKLFFYDIPEYKSGDMARRAANIYEPWFTAIHGEKSGLEGTVTGPPNEPSRA